MIGCDLIRDMHMYKLPSIHEEELQKKYGKIIWIDPPYYLGIKDLDKIEIYFGDRITAEMAKHMPNLKWIHLSCVGTDKLKGELNKDIVVTNSKGILTQQMISTILGFMFGLSRLQPQLSANQFTREDVDKLYMDKIQDVFGQRCCIVGCGEVGNKLKDILHDTFDMTVFTINRTTSFWKLSELKYVVAASDFVINLLPLTDDTKNVFDKYIFTNMKPSSYFINIGRGGTVVENDLINALFANEIAGAGLDVFETEPLPKDSPLLKLNNVMLSPHIASYSKTYWEREYNLFKDNLELYKQGKKLLNIVKL